MKRLKSLYAIWKRVAEAIGNFMSRLVLSALYFTIVPIFSGIQRLVDDPFHKNGNNDNSAWQQRSDSAATSDIRKLRMPY